MLYVRVDTLVGGAKSSWKGAFGSFAELGARGSRADAKDFDFEDERRFGKAAEGVAKYSGEERKAAKGGA
eukprot:6198782-Karenia_brevis.AAC.1